MYLGLLASTTSQGVQIRVDRNPAGGFEVTRRSYGEDEENPGVFNVPFGDGVPIGINLFKDSPDLAHIFKRYGTVMDVEQHEYDYVKGKLVIKTKNQGLVYVEPKDSEGRPLRVEILRRHKKVVYGNSSDTWAKKDALEATDAEGNNITINPDEVEDVLSKRGIYGYKGRWLLYSIQGNVFAETLYDNQMLEIGRRGET